MSATETCAKAIASRLSKSETRIWTHVSLLCIVAAFVFSAEFIMDAPPPAGMAADKKLHYEVGRVAASIVVLAAYTCVIARVVLAARGSVTKALLWLPTLLGISLLAAVGAGIAFGAGKEMLDAASAGGVEWLDLTATLDGAMTIVPAAVLVMALTPLFIPLDIIMQAPRLLLADARTSVRTLGDYVKARKTHKKCHRPAQVLLVEDDIVCATTVLEFCRLAGLVCHHVCSIAEADRYLKRHRAVRLVLLDNFVRVEGSDGPRTGSQWLAELATSFPLAQRQFSVAIISGHADRLGQAAADADLVLPKPWDPKHLADFLASKRLLGTQALSMN